MNESDRILVLGEIATKTRMTPPTIRYKRLRGELPFLFKLGRNLVAYEGEVDEWIQSQRDTTSRSAS